MRPDDLHPGDLIAGKYRVRAILARQPSMVVEAFHTEFDQRAVIKVLPAWAADAKEVERFRREARILAKLESEHVARILDVGTEKDGSFYLVRQHLEGEDLGAHVQRVGALALDEAVLIVMQIAEAVAETHTHGIVIRELSPAHVHLARRPGGAPIAKITDFGTAKLMRDAAAPAGNSSLTATAMFGLSPYSSPEMVRKAKSVDGRTDVWSLGAILYHLLTGQAPFAGDVATLMLSITRDEPTPASTLRRGLTQELDQVVAWALAKDVDRRFRDVSAFAHALAAYGGPEAQILAERIAGIRAAARGAKDGPPSSHSPPGSHPSTAPRAMSAPPGRSGAPGSRPPPPGPAPSQRPPAPGQGPVRTSPPPPMGGGASGVVAAMRSRLPSGLDDLPAGDDDATVVLGSEDPVRRGVSALATIPPPPPSMPPTPWQPGAERARSPRLVPPAVLSGAGASQGVSAAAVGAAAMGSGSLGGMGGPMGHSQEAVSSLGSSSLGGSSPPGQGHPVAARDANGRDGSLSPASSTAMQRATKTQGGQDRRVLVGALAAMAVLLPVILVLLLSRKEPKGEPVAATGAIAVPTPPVATPRPDPVDPRVDATPDITATAAPSAAPVASAAPSASAVAVAANDPPPSGTLPAWARKPPPSREPPPAREPPPKKDEPKSSGGSQGNLLAIASGGSCTFLVNGSAKGSGSSVKVQLSPGNYTVTCKPSSGATKSRGVSIKPGETSMLTFKL